MMTNRKVLILSAHPDDEAIGCGGVIARLSSEGYNSTLITFTDGIGSRLRGGDRRHEVEQSASILGISQFVCGDFPDNMMDSVPLLEVCQFIEANVEDKYDVILTHHPHCLNIDHKVVFEATRVVFRPQSGYEHSLYAYPVSSSTNYNPIANNLTPVYFDVAGYVDQKMGALKIYAGEMRPDPHARSVENVINMMKVWGSEVGLKYAEKLYHIRSVI